MVAAALWFQAPESRRTSAAPFGKGLSCSSGPSFRPVVLTVLPGRVGGTDRPSPGFPARRCPHLGRLPLVMTVIRACSPLAGSYFRPGAGLCAKEQRTGPRLDRLFVRELATVRPLGGGGGDTWRSARNCGVRPPRPRPAVFAAELYRGASTDKASLFIPWTVGLRGRLAGRLTARDDCVNSAPEKNKL